MSNKMIERNPSLLDEWDYIKNSKLNVDINKITTRSAVKVWWICPKCKSSYDSSPDFRSKSGCPYCSGRKVNNTNSLASLKPDLSTEWHLTLNGNLSPHNVTCGSNKKVWWSCVKCKSEYPSQVNSRSGGTGCPYCSNQKVNNTNSLTSIRPDVLNEWDVGRNKNIKPESMAYNSSKSVWWKCDNCNFNFKKPIQVITGESYKGCKRCNLMGKNNELSLLSMSLDLSEEWHPNKNGEVTPENIHFNSSKVAWWVCSKCTSEYNVKIYRRTKEHQNCPYCSGARVNHTNSLLALKPRIASEWHPTKNGLLLPIEFSLGSNKKVWWLGKCEHEWEALIASRAQYNTGCPYCIHNPKTLKGFNDMWTTNPELAKQLLNPEDGYKYTENSGKKASWVCLECDSLVGLRVIQSIKKEGLSCPSCSDGIPFTEKMVYNILKNANIAFEFDSPTTWSQGKRYDFYLTDLNWIIEVHGKQHYEEGFSSFGLRTLKEEQENDFLKHEMAINNNISKYVIIDARESTVEWIRNSVNKSALKNIIENIDYNDVGLKSTKSMVLMACDLWNSGIRNTLQIADEMVLSRTTIGSYLKRGTEIGYCDYDVEIVLSETIKLRSKINGLRAKGVVQLSMEGEYVNEFRSISFAVAETKILNISNVCNGKARQAGNYKWIFKKDY